MGAIDEMYKKYGATFKVPSPMMLRANGCMLETYYESAYTEGYKPFTTEKQLKLLKTIGLLGNVCITKREYNDMWCITTHHKNGIGQDLIFEEALSKWITNIYDSLSVTIRNKVKEILER